ncbi:Uncharacterised protein [Escherichia coli]|uniref:hypothetical protein n=1 Tax=Escherichia coli TaxID=562 RepID=UPI000DFD5503|nr:hypothetical protein [Escherichia coli]STM96309.1 Uncharacterised protein [Escherichia coli]
MIGSMPNCDRRWMPNHERFEYQTVIDSDAILQYRSQRGKIKMKSLSGYKGEYENVFYKNKFFIINIVYYTNDCHVIALRKNNGGIEVFNPNEGVIRF